MHTNAIIAVKYGALEHWSTVAQKYHIIILVFKQKSEFPIAHVTHITHSIV